MAVLDLVFELGIILVPMLIVTIAVIIGFEAVTSSVMHWRWRLSAISIPLIFLSMTVGVRFISRDVLGIISWRVVGIYLTSFIFTFEEAVFGTNPVSLLQGLASEPLTMYFIFMYIYGYAFLLVFPAIAYFSLNEMSELKTLLMAFAINYLIGVLLYTLFIAYGPRNYDPLLFQDLLYTTFPQARYLTDMVNESTNVFPSLHSSMSVTVMILAWYTRHRFRLWFPLAVFIGMSVLLSTMYLGIHWFSDVLAGAGLAIFSVWISRRYVSSSIEESIKRYVSARVRRTPGG